MMATGRTTWGSLGLARLILLAAIPALLIGGSSPPASVQARPSVLLITLDTVRADHLGCYGDVRSQTPNIDRLASESVRFANAYTQAPITLPSHAVILTSTYPMFNGVRDFTSHGLPRGIPTLAELLRRHGYATGAFVSSFALDSMWGLNRGFDVYDDRVGQDTVHAGDPFLLMRSGDRTTDRLLEWLDRNGSQPFFAWLHLYDAHSPYRSPPAYRARFPGRPYDAAIAFEDTQVGRVLARLRARSLYRNTLIVLTSDHGESLGEHGESEHGFFVYNATLHVPLIVHWPEHWPGQPPQSVLKDPAPSVPVSTLDIAPTIAQACAVPTTESASFQGHSLGRWLRPGVVPHDHVYAESYYPRDSFGWSELRCLVTSRFKYIAAPHPELYDLARDPMERVNLIASNAAVAASLGEELAAIEQRYAGPPQRPPAPLDAETLEKLKSLGYLSYTAGSHPGGKAANLADPKDKIGVLNQILHSTDLTRLRQYAEADDAWRRLEQAEPHLYVIPFERGENAIAWGKPEAAVAEFRKSLALNSTFDQALLGLGRADFATGQDSQAASAFELALRLNPRQPAAGLALAQVYWRTNELEKARAMLATLVQAHPDSAEGHTDRGITLVKLGQYREALPEIQRGIALGYRDAVAYNYLGIALADVGRGAQAVGAYEQAVRLDPRYAAAYLNLAFQYGKQGDAAKARAAYQKVCKLSEELCGQYRTQFPPRR